MTPPSATTSWRWRHVNTSWNHGYKGIAENGRAGSHLVPMILQWPPTKKEPKGRRGQEFWVHTYPTVSSRPRARRVQSLVQIGSEMWICISSIQTKKHLSLYIRLKICKNCSCNNLRSQLRTFMRSYWTLHRCLLVQPDDGFLIKPKYVAAGPKNIWCVRLLY